MHRKRIYLLLLSLLMLICCKENSLPTGEVVLQKSVSLSVKNCYFIDSTFVNIDFNILNNSNYNIQIDSAFLEKNINGCYTNTPSGVSSGSSFSVERFNSVTLKLKCPDSGSYRIGIACRWKNISHETDIIYTNLFRVIPEITNIAFRNLDVDKYNYLDPPTGMKFVIQNIQDVESVSRFYRYNTKATFYNLLSNTNFSDSTLIGMTWGEGLAGNGSFKIDSLVISRNTLRVKSTMIYSTVGYTMPIVYSSIVAIKKTGLPVLFEAVKIKK